MTNINCSAECIHENNGKCTLNHVSITQNVMGFDTDCAYFTPRKNKPAFQQACFKWFISLSFHQHKYDQSKLLQEVSCKVP
jgi:hypothetical protein